MSARHVGGCGVALVVLVAGGRTVLAQPLVNAPPASGPSAAPELRVDAFAGRASGAQLGVGVGFDAGTYTRLALIAGVGAERRPGGAVVGVQRIEGVARFHFDPFRQSRRGVYAGGGVAVRHTPGGPARVLLVGLLGVEGAPRRAVATAIEAGVGGGVRVGLILRRARLQRR